jgi:hypothetical protein
MIRLKPQLVPIAADGHCHPGRRGRPMSLQAALTPRSAPPGLHGFHRGRQRRRIAAVMAHLEHGVAQIHARAVNYIHLTFYGNAFVCVKTSILV